MKKEVFIKTLHNKGLILSNQQIGQLDLYYKMLVEANQKFNLTAIVALEEVYEKHFYDCAIPTFVVKFAEKRILDIGSGAGFPGVLLKILCPTAKIQIIDANGKKIAFINHLIEELGLSYIQAIQARAEEYSIAHKELFDYAIARAVGSIPMLLEISAQALKVDGALIAMKGSNAIQEIEEAKGAAKTLGFQLVKDYSHLLPISGADRHIVIYQKMTKTPNIYPRRFNLIKDKPL